MRSFNGYVSARPSPRLVVEAVYKKVTFKLIKIEPANLNAFLGQCHNLGITCTHIHAYFLSLLYMLISFSDLV